MITLDTGHHPVQTVETTHNPCDARVDASVQSKSTDFVYDLCRTFVSHKMMQQRTPPASPLSDATNKVNASPATPTTALSKTPTALSVRSQTNAKNLMHPRPTQPAYQTPMAKLTHPSPEPTITSLRMLNVVLQKRLTREEDSRNQRTQAFDLCTTYMQPLPTVQALVARNEQQQQRLIEVIRAKQDQLRLSLEQQCDLTSTVRSLQDSQRQHMVVQADQDREIHKLKAQLADFQQQVGTNMARRNELCWQNKKAGS